MVGTAPIFASRGSRSKVGDGQMGRPTDRPTRRGMLLPADLEAGACGDHRRWSSVDGVDDLSLSAVDSLEVSARGAEVDVPELALNDDERDAFVGHLYRVRVSQLV
jgi:hypothetical protein